MKKRMTFVFLAMATGFILYPGEPVKVVHNTRKEIDACMGKVQITLVRTWGGDDEEDENKFFKFPWDIVVDKKGMVYVCDESNHRIQVFDEAGNYKRTIGARGNGPTDFLNPNALDLDIREDIVVSDSMNHRIQALTPEGKYVGGFKCGGISLTDIDAAHKKDEIVIYSQLKSFYSKKLLFVYDKNGKLTRDIGKYVDDNKEPGEAGGIGFTLDENDNIYTSYTSAPYLLKFSYSGDILMLITYETPYESPKIRLDSLNKSVIIEDGKKSSGAINPAIDSLGRIYIVGANRKTTENDKETGSIISVSKRGSGTIRYMPPLKYGKTDLYRLIAFNPAGKVVAAAQLDVYLNKIYVHGNRLFIIDTYRAMCIYEYKITFR